MGFLLFDVAAALAFLTSKLFYSSAFGFDLFFTLVLMPKRAAPPGFFFGSRVRQKKCERVKGNAELQISFSLMNSCFLSLSNRVAKPLFPLNGIKLRIFFWFQNLTLNLYHSIPEKLALAP